MPSRVMDSIPCGTRSSSCSTKDLLLTSSFPKRRSWRLRPEPILRSLSSQRPRCIAVRLLARTRKDRELEKDDGDRYPASQRDGGRRGISSLSGFRDECLRPPVQLADPVPLVERRRARTSLEL